MRFDYFEPVTLEEALTLLNKNSGKARIIAGGTDLMLQIRNRTVRPELVIDITGIPGLDYINCDTQQGLKLGSLTTIRALEKSAELTEKYPILSQAASQLGSVAIRNVATVGGNLCSALPSADTAQALMALSARVRVLALAGERDMTLEDFFTGVGKTALAPGEILVGITVPKLAPNTRGMHIKHSARGSIDLAIVNIAVILTIDSGDNVCTDIKIVMGAVAPTPIRARKAEAVLIGKRIDKALIDHVALVASEEANPRAGSIRGSPEYKKEMIRVLTGRALRTLVAL